MTSPIQPNLIERAAKAICAASGEIWKDGTYRVVSGPNFEVEDHPLDPFNNHWRAKAKAALEAAGITTLQAQLERVTEAAGAIVSCGCCDAALYDLHQALA